MAQDNSKLREQLQRRMGALDTERQSYQQHWMELSDYILPRKGRFMTAANATNKGSKRNQKIIDPTGTLAARTLANGLMSGMTSPTRPWFRLTVGDPDLREFGPVKLWLAEVEARMRRVFQRSNLYQALPAIYEELGVFGTAALVELEDFDTGVRFYPMTVGEYWLGSSSRLDIDTLYREFPRTVAQVVQQFGRDACSPSTKNMFDRGQLDAEILICHACEPNDERIVDAAGAKGMAYRSVYWEKGAPDTMLLSVRGFERRPFMAPRWHVAGNDTYGRSPAMDALPDIRTLQVQQKRKAQGIDKMVNPPMVAHPSMRNEPASLLPGGMTYAADFGQNTPGLRPVYQVDPRLGELKDDIRETQYRVQQAFYADLFLAISQLETTGRTATEIAERRDEKYSQLGPALDRVHNELLSPIIDRTFDIMFKMGMIPPPPQELEGVELQPEYISTLAQVQKARESTTLERMLSVVGNAAAVKPDVLDKVDFDQAMDEYAEMLGVNPRIIVSDDKVVEIRAARQQQMQAAQAMESTASMAQSAKVLSETDVGGGQSALERVVGL